MKLILLRNDYKDIDKSFFQKRAKDAGVKLTAVSWDNLEIEIRGKRLLFKANGTPISNFDAVYVRTIYEHLYELIQLATFCNLNNIPIIDRSLIVPGRLSDNKMRQLMLAQNSGINIPHSFLVAKNSIPEKLRQINTFPVFIKATDFNRGKGVYFIKNPNHAKLLINRRINGKNTRNFIIQERIDYVKDYRIIVLGDKILGVILRKSSNTDIRANISRGGSSINVESLPRKLKDLALKVTRALDIEIAGVDFLEDEKGNFYFLESNRAFGFEGFEKATGLDVTFEIFKYIKENYS